MPQYQTTKDTIPKTVLKYTTVNADLSSLKGRAELLAVNRNFAIIGLDNLPFILFANQQFNIENIPATLQKDIYSIKRLVFQPSFEYDYLNDSYCLVPSWVEKFKHVRYLKLNHIDISQLSQLINLPIEFLEFNNIKIGEKDYGQLIEVIETLRELHGIVYDPSVPIQLLELVKKKHPEYTLYSTLDKSQMAAFDKKLEKDTDLK